MEVEILLTAFEKCPSTALGMTKAVKRLKRTAGPIIIKSRKASASKK